MSAETIHPAQPHNTPGEQVRRYDVVMENISARVDKLHDGSPPEDQAKIDQLNDTLPRTGVADADMEPFHAIRHDPSRSAVERTFAGQAISARRAIDGQNRAMEKHAPILSEEILAEWTTLQPRIDYASVIHGVATGQDKDEKQQSMFAKLQWVGRITNDIRKGKRDTHYGNLTYVQGLMHLLPQRDPAEAVESKDDIRSANESIALLEDRIAHASRLAQLYSKVRDGMDLLGFPDDEAAQFDFFTRTLADEDLADDPYYQRALDGFTDQFIADSASFFTDPEAAVEQPPIPPIIGFESEASVTKEAVIKEWLTNNIPAAFFRGVRDITRVEPGSMDNPEQIKQGRTVTGEHDSITGAIRLAEGLVQLEGRDHEDLIGLLFNELIKKIKDTGYTTPMLATLGHEIAHNVHNQVLDYDDLAGWETVMAEEDVAVSNYVRSFVGRADDIRKQEDFTESFRMFIQEPETLMLLASQRFTYMYQLFLKYDTRTFDLGSDETAKTWFGRASFVVLGQALKMAQKAELAQA